MVVTQKEAGAEKKTNIIFFSERHDLYSFELFKRNIERNPPNVLSLEHPKLQGFEEMLDGKISVKKYIESAPGRWLFPEFAKKLFELAKELHKEKGVKVEPSAIELYGDKGVILWSAVYAGARREQDLCIRRGDFEGGVATMVACAQAGGNRDFFLDKGRAREIADRIKSGEWSGNILVEAGAGHSLAKYFLQEELKGMKNVSISSVYPFKEIVKETFGDLKSEAYSPTEQLEKMFEHEAWTGTRTVIEEEIKLIGARGLVYLMIAKLPTNEGDERIWYEVIKKMEQLSYDECKEIFNEICSKGMNSDEAFKHVEDYLKKKAE